MKVRTICFSLAVLASLLLASTTLAQAPCMPRLALLESLSRQYSESPVAVGVTMNNELMEMVVAPDGSTWTIIITSLRGRACIIAAGERWRVVPVAEIDGPRI